MIECCKGWGYDVCVSRVAFMQSFVFICEFFSYSITLDRII